MGTCIDKVLYEEPEPEKERPWWMKTTPEELKRCAIRRLDLLRSFKEMARNLARVDAALYVAGQIDDAQFWHRRHTTHVYAETDTQRALENEDWAKLTEVLDYEYGDPNAGRLKHDSMLTRFRNGFL